MAKSGNHIGEEKILYVEGPNDKWVTISLRQQYQHKEDVNIIDLENCDIALQAFATKAASPSETKKLGLIIDADSDIKARYQDIIKELRKSLNIEISEQELAMKDGFVKEIRNISEDDIKIGIWIMPDNIGNGRLEDFLFEKIDAENELFLQIEPALKTLEATALGNTPLVSKMYKPIHRDKAKLHTYIAWSEHPDVSMGIAVKASLFEKVSETESKFRAWLEKLFY